MADPNDTNGAPPRQIHIEDKKTNWLAWIALLLGILALLFALSRCNRNETAAVAPAPSPSASATPSEVVGETSGAPNSMALAGVSGLGGYFQGSEPAPRTFTFEKVNFDTAKSDIRPADQDEIDAVAATLKQYGNAHIKIAGYADSRGSNAANNALGKARADSVKAALVAKGIDGGRIETASGGEGDPVDTNATASGQAENRRTELVVTQR